MKRHSLSSVFRIPAAHAETESDLEAQPVDYRTNFVTFPEEERKSEFHRHSRKSQYLTLVQRQYTFIPGDGIRTNFCNAAHSDIPNLLRNLRDKRL